MRPYVRTTRGGGGPTARAVPRTSVKTHPTELSARKTTVSRKPVYNDYEFCSRSRRAIQRRVVVSPKPRRASRTAVAFLDLSDNLFLLFFFPFVTRLIKQLYLPYHASLPSIMIENLPKVFQFGFECLNKVKGTY